MNYQEIQDLWIKNGGAPGWAPLMAGIAIAESGGNTAALNPNSGTGDYSVGLWQINYFGSMLGPRSQRYGTPQDLLNDPNKQARAAIDLFGQNGAGLSNWTNDATWNAWVKAGSPQQPDAATVQSWLNGKTGAPGAQTPTLGGVTLAATYNGKTVGCNPGGGINILFGHIGTGCQIKAFTGGLLVAVGATVFLTGVILTVAAGLAGTSVGKAATGAVGSKGPIGTVAKTIGGASKSVGTRIPDRDDRLYARTQREAPQRLERNARYRSQEAAARRAGAPSRTQELAEEPF